MTPAAGASRPVVISALVVAVCATLLAVISAHRSMQRLDSAHDWVGHSHQVLRTITRVRSHVNAAHAERRGAWFTETHDFITRHDSLLRETVSEVNALRELTRDNPEQQERLDSLRWALSELAASSRRLRDLHPRIAEPRSALEDQARAEAHFSQIAGIVERLEREEEDLLAARTAVSEAATHWARAVVIVSLVFAAGLATLALWPLFHALRRSRRIQQALTTREARYRRLVEGAADAIVITTDGVCVEANEAAERLFGCARDELQGQRIQTLISDVHGGVDGFLALPAGESAAAECVARRRDGDVRPVEVSVAAFPDAVLQLILRDITSRKELERMKDELVSVVSHELRTPVTAIRGSIRLLKAAPPAMEQTQRERLLHLAESNADRLIRLINDLLDVERFSSGAMPLELAPADLLELASDVVDGIRPIAEQAGVEVRVDGTPVTTLVDSARVSQVLTNLVGNAVKFSPRGAAVEVEVGAAGGSALVAVHDHGRGIPQDQLETVFERFHQVHRSDAREKGGTGLGLAISRQIVVQHGGRIWAESGRGGSGSTFTFTIPLDAEAREATT